MPVNISRLRLWFATAAIVLVAVVAGFYFYGRMRVRRAIGEVPRHLGINIEQSTQGFTLSKSEGGHTLFTVHASKAVQYKESGKAELRDVSIIVYGRQANRYDQIYGADFEYDPRSGDVAAKSEVHIDLEGNAEGPLTADQTPPPELKNPIHLKTSGLLFNAKTGLARTAEAIEFRVPQANGSAVGASYDSKAATLTLDSNIVVHSTDASAASIVARHGVITKGPNRAMLQDVRMTSNTGSFAGSQLTVYFRDDNTIEHMTATGDVRAVSTGKNTHELRAAAAEAWVDARNSLRTATFSGNVSLNASGEQPMSGTAGKLTVDFGPHNRAGKVRAANGVKLLQQPGSKDSHPVEISAAAIDFQVQNGRALQQAITSGPAQVTVLPVPGASGQNAAQTVASAGRFEARFNRQNRIEHVTGMPNVKVVSTAPGQPPKTSTSDRLDVTFNPRGNISAMLQEGHFHYSEPATGTAGERTAWADHARYTPEDEALLLTGSPRIIDGGMTISADTLRLFRRSGNLVASGDVKTTYSELKPQPGGALLASSDPIHVTAPEMRATRSAGTALYYGGARLWQGSSIVQAPSIEFDQRNRKILAQPSTPRVPGAVTTTFVQQDRNGKMTPVSVCSTSLAYLDSERRARLEGGVVVRGADATVTADRADVYLQAKGKNFPASTSPGPSQIERIVAEGHVNIQEPNRRATGETLVYTASEGKFVLTGGSPSIFDAERGKITGGSLTFYNRDDRVVVESSNSSPTVTQTRVAK